MNIKVFNIRLAKEFFANTTRIKMNEFLDDVEVKLTSTNFVTNGKTDLWSAAVFYLSKNSKKEHTEIKISEEDLSGNERNIFNALRQ